MCSLYFNSFCFKLLSSQTKKNRPLEFEITIVNCIIIFIIINIIIIIIIIDCIFLIFPENRIWHFKQIVSIIDNLHEMSNLFSGKK